MNWNPFVAWFFTFGILGFVALLFMNWWAGLFCGAMILLGGFGYMIEDGF